MSSPVEIGDVLAGKYRIERVLGVGGMGVVVAAQHLRLEQLVAIKFLLPAAFESDEVVARFAREARAASKIQSEHVARVIDVGELDNGAPYMVMEYLEGSDLSDILVAETRLAIPRAVDYLLEACEALAEAHAVGIVHRDLKPANLFLAKRADGGAIIKVLDFGISKAGTDAGVSAARLTGTAVIMGSPLYMSPEQLRSSRDVDARTDIWSLGILLFELLTGQTPFVGETVTEIIANIMTEDAPPLSSVCPEASPELDAVLALCLARKRDKRYESVADFAQELAPFGTAAAAISAEHIRRVLRVSLSARDSLAGDVPTARLSAAKTVRDPTLASAEPVGRSTEDPVSVGAKTAPDFGRPADVAQADDVAAAIAAIAKGGDGDTAISPGGKAASVQRGAAASGSGPETAPPTDSASKRVVAIAAGTIVVGLLAIAGVTASRRGPGEPVASGDPSARVATLAPASASAPSGATTETAAPVLAPAPSSTPALTVVDAAASASASARGGSKGPPPKPGAATAAAPATTAPAVAPPPATTTAAAPATTAAPPAPKPGNPLDKLDKVQ